MCGEGRAGRRPPGDTELASSPTLHPHFLSLSVPAEASLRPPRPRVPRPSSNSRQKPRWTRLLVGKSGRWGRGLAGRSHGAGREPAWGRTDCPVCVLGTSRATPRPATALPPTGSAAAAGHCRRGERGPHRQTLPSRATTVTVDHVTTATHSAA